MVDAQVAGVLFTADPVSGRRTRAVLDASPGLGEAVVSGMVNPDHLAVEDGRVVDRRLGDKAVAVRALPGGGTERVELARGSDATCVTDAQAVALAALGRRVEAHFGVAAGHRVGARRRRRDLAHPGAADHQPLPRAARHATARCARSSASAWPRG